MEIAIAAITLAIVLAGLLVSGYQLKIQLEERRQAWRMRATGRNARQNARAKAAAGM